MKMKINVSNWFVCLTTRYLLLLVTPIVGTTIKTLETIKIAENLGIGEEIFDLRKIDRRILRFNLLNLNGFEENYFRVDNDEKKIFVKSPIDREEFVEKKRCFGASKCLIELHLLINDGEEYLVVPVEIEDTNDNEPKFLEKSISLKFDLDQIKDDEKVFLGAEDLDENENGEIKYLLDCGSMFEENSTKFVDRKWRKVTSQFEQSKNCFDLFVVSFLSKIFGKIDQFKLKIDFQRWLDMSRQFRFKTKFELVLFCFNEAPKIGMNSMKIAVEIEKNEEQIDFLSEETIFVTDENVKTGKVFRFELENSFRSAKFFDSTKFFYDENSKFEFSTSARRIDFRFGNLEEFRRASANSEFSFRFKTNDKKNFLLKIRVEKRFVEQIENISFESNSTSVEIEKKSHFFELNLFESNFRSIQLELRPKLDEFYFLALDEPKNEFFRLENGSSKNKFLLEIFDPRTTNFSAKIVHRETKHRFNADFRIRRAFSEEFCRSKQRNWTLESFADKQKWTFSFLPSSFQREQRLSFPHDFFFDGQKRNFFLGFCRMKFSFDAPNFIANRSTHRICSAKRFCFNSTFFNQTEIEAERIHSIFSFLVSNLDRPFSSTSIIVLGFIFMFIAIFLFLIFLLHHCRSFSICLTMKNYCFLGKKYRLAQKQKTSAEKINSRIQSIVIKESDSPLPFYPSLDQIQQQLYHLSMKKSFSSNFESNSTENTSRKYEKDPSIDGLSISSSVSHLPLELSKLASEV